jgi:hypothetical protein
LIAAGRLVGGRSEAEAIIAILAAARDQIRLPWLKAAREPTETERFRRPAARCGRGGQGARGWRHLPGRRLPGAYLCLIYRQSARSDDLHSPPSFDHARFATRGAARKRPPGAIGRHTAAGISIQPDAAQDRSGCALSPSRSRTCAGEVSGRSRRLSEWSGQRIRWPRRGWPLSRPEP